MLEEIDLKSTLEAILRNAVNALGGSAGVIASWSEAEHRFVVTASYGLDAQAMAQLYPFLDEAIPDLAASRESFDLLSDLRPDLVSRSSRHPKVNYNPIIALPLQIGKKSLGLIYVLRPLNAAVFSRIDQSTLAVFAEQAAIAVQNAKLAHFLAAEKQRLESILENSADGIVNIDGQRRIIGFNLAMERLVGRPREDVLGKDCFRILNLRDWQGQSLCNTSCPLLKSSGQSNQTFELQGTIWTADRRNIDVAMIYSILYSPEGKPVNAVVNVRDISKLREVENLRETFLSMLGHELQTPLSIIKGYTSTLTQNEHKWDPEVIRNSLKVIEAESDRLSRIMNKLLLASQIASGMPTLSKEEVQLPSLVEKVVRRLRMTTTIHSFHVEFEADFPPVLVDPMLMEEVLTNLIENAIKYSPNGGKIAICGRNIGNEVRLDVIDEGIGIPREDMERIFNRFERTDRGFVKKVKGMGLGLYICKSIIEAHGGRIEVESKVGKGSQFTLILPLSQDV